MNSKRLNLENPIRDAISRVRFALHSNNLLISSWDSNLRLYDVESDKLRIEAAVDAAILDCCFENETVALTSCSDGSIHRSDMQSGLDVTVGDHDDIATCIEFSNETCQMVSAGWDRRIKFWDVRVPECHGCLSTFDKEPDSIAISGFNLMVALGTSVVIYDLRNLKKPVQERNMSVRIKCLRPIFGHEGFAVGSFDGRVALEYFSEQGKKEGLGYAFRCHPKGKDGRHHLVAVNDIAFGPYGQGAFTTGDNEGYAIMWNGHIKKRLYELPRYSNSIAALEYNSDGLLLAVASSYTCQEATEREEPPQIFVHKIDNNFVRSLSAGFSEGKPLQSE